MHYRYINDPYYLPANINASESHGHTHSHDGATSCDDGHIHYYEAYSSTPIPLPGGFHTHYTEFQTTENDGHVHTIKGYTQPSKS